MCQMQMVGWRSGRQRCMHSMVRQGRLDSGAAAPGIQRQRRRQRARFKTRIPPSQPSTCLHCRVYLIGYNRVGMPLCHRVHMEKSTFQKGCRNRRADSTRCFPKLKIDDLHATKLFRLTNRGPSPSYLLANLPFNCKSSCHFFLLDQAICLQNRYLVILP